MPLSGDVDGLKRLHGSMRSLARGDAMLAGARPQVTSLLREQLIKGIAPDGSPLQETKRHQAPFRSKRLGSAFKGKVERGGLRFTSKTTRDMLDAHNFGHVFPARKRAENQQFLTFDRRGRLIKNKRAINKKGNVRRGVYQTFARSHTVGARLLPARQIVPEGTMPQRYAEAIGVGVTKGIERWHQRAVK